jgi:hypothetical protein
MKERAVLLDDREFQLKMEVAPPSSVIGEKQSMD